MSSEFWDRLVRALLEGRKTQMWWVVKPQPEFTEPETAWQYGDGHGGIGWYAYSADYPDEGSEFYRCPYGPPGDLLYVRAARIWLRVVDVRVERVQEITEEEARAEGLLYDASEELWAHWETAWKVGWDSRNAKRGFGWGANPWVWVIEFERAEK